MSDLPVLILTHETFVIFSLPCPVEEGSDRAALVGTWHPARVNPPHLPIQNAAAKNMYLSKTFGDIVTICVLSSGFLLSMP